MDRRIDPRQLPGNACQECRKKKLRCDRQRPKCGSCVSAQVHCEVTERRATRVGKAGNINELYRRISERGYLIYVTLLNNKIDALEQRLSSSQIEGALRPNTHDFDVNEFVAIDNQPQDHFLSFTDWDISGEEQSLPSLMHLDNSDSDIGPQALDLSLPSPSLVPQSAFDDTIPSQLVKEDLIQLYIDRVHSIIPFLSPSKLLKWSSDTGEVSESCQCLRYAVYTTATAFSSQFGTMQDAIYTKTRSMLERFDMNSIESEPYKIAYIQAWVLITFYELAKTTYRRAWLSAGRVFRLVQFTKLHDLDNPTTNLAEVENDPISLEEKRRTFWVAYYLDGLMSLSEGTSVTWNEESIFTRLPCTDANLQTGLVEHEVFLLEAMSSVDMRHYSPLAECAILVTIYSKKLPSQQAIKPDFMNTSTPLDVFARHDWFDAVITRRLKSLQTNYLPTSLALDPMVVFCYMLAYSAIVHMCNIIETMPRSQQNQALIWQFQERGLWAAQEIARLASEHQHAGYFKAHTLMPLVIYLGVLRLEKHLAIRTGELDAKTLESIEKSRRTSVEVLHKLKSVNHLSGHYCHLLK